jgi:hypothetical protein
MANSTTPTPAWACLAAPDRHPPKGPVALPLCPFVVHRPASTIHGQAAARAADSTI